MGREILRKVLRRACLLDSLDARKAKGKFVVCISNDTAVSTWIHQLTVQNAGGIGMVLVDDLEMFDANDFGTFPATTVSKTSATEIISYIKSTRCVRSLHILCRMIMISMNYSQYNPITVWLFLMLHALS